MMSMRRKANIGVIIILLVFCSIAYGIDNWEWVRKNWYDVVGFQDVFILRGTQLGWAVDAEYDTFPSSTITHTTDGGLTWRPQGGQGSVLESIFFIDSLRGWAVGGSGYQGIILGTLDGGRTWALQFVAPGFVDCIYFINRNEGWAGCYFGYILHTEDGGNTWEVQYTLPDTSWIEEIFFTDSLTGYLVSDVPGGVPPGYIARAYKTTNGGQSWFPLSISFDLMEIVYALYFYNSNLGWIGTSYGIHKTTDCGATWSYYSLPSQDYIRAIDFVDSLYGWAVGGDYTLAQSDVYYTTNGGQTWTEVYCPRHNQLLSVSASDRNNVWTAGKIGVIMYSSDGGVTWEYQIGPGDDLIAMDAPDTLNVWAVGGYGTVLHSSDEGYNWEVIDPGINSYIYGVSFPTIDQGWVAGGRNGVRHTSDGGVTWEVQDLSNTYMHWRDVDFPDTLNGWIVASDGDYPPCIYHTSDGGNSWDKQFETSDFAIVQVDFFNQDTGLVVGGDYLTNGKVVRTVNGGQTWEIINVPIPSPAKIYDVDFASSSTEAWAVSIEGTVLRSVDAGATWITINDTTIGTADLYTVDFVDRNNGWVVGHGAFRTRDGGVTWSKDSGNVGTIGIVYIDIVAKDTVHAWVGAGMGRIWKYDASVGVKEICQIREISGLSLYAYPNPFRTSIEISYQSPTAEQPISLKIYDVTGRVVKDFNLPTLYASRPAFITWDGMDDSGDYLAPGIYFVQLKALHYCVTRKICKLK